MIDALWHTRPWVENGKLFQMHSAEDDARYEFAHALTVEAGELALAHFRNLEALVIEEKKSGQDVVSMADREVEDLIRTRISTAFPDDGFLGEETGLTEGTSGYRWVVDPIDGTSCFLHGYREWCVSVALMKGDETIAGLVYQPTVDEFFTARKGSGAFLNGRPIRVDTRASIANGLLGLGANGRVPIRSVTCFAEVLLEAGGMFIRSGSGALMLAHVACGRLAGYYEPHINAWDCLAALCLIREAGGWTADFPVSDGLLTGGKVVGAAPQVSDELETLIELAAARAAL